MSRLQLLGEVLQSLSEVLKLCLETALHGLIDGRVGCLLFRGQGRGEGLRLLERLLECGDLVVEGLDLELFLLELLPEIVNQRALLGSRGDWCSGAAVSGEPLLKLREIGAQNSGRGGGEGQLDLAGKIRNQGLQFRDEALEGLAFPIGLALPKAFLVVG